MTDTARPVAHIHGAAVSISWADPSRSLTDLIFDGVSAALADSGLSIHETDSIVLAAHDLIDGRSLSSMVTAPAAGAYLRDEIRLSEDGLAAFSLATARVEAGESSLSVVAAWGRASEGGYPWLARTGADPFTEQPLGLTDLDVSAFRLSRRLACRPDGDAARRHAAATRTERAGANPRALRTGGCVRPLPYPLRTDEGPLLADVVAAVIVGRRPSPVRLAGVGHGTDESAIGARDFAAMTALQQAARQAFTGARCAPAEIGVAELDGLTLVDEALSLEASGLAPPGEGFDVYGRDPRLNASGGGARGWCYPAMGLARLVEAYLRLRDLPEAGAGARRLALATGLGGNGSQTATAVILEAT